jgi:hypothetical protein
MLQYIGNQTTNNPTRNYNNSAHVVVPVSVTAVSALAARIDRKRLIIVNRSINSLYVAAGTVASKPATAANAEIEIPGQYAYEFSAVPLTAINFLWASNSTPDARAEALITENW